MRAVLNPDDTPRSAPRDPIINELPPGTLAVVTEVSGDGIHRVGDIVMRVFTSSDYPILNFRSPTTKYSSQVRGRVLLPGESVTITVDTVEAE